MPGDFTVDNWDEVALIVGVLSAIMGVCFGFVWNALKHRLESRAADDAAHDRLIKLVETEAEKRIAVVRVDFELKIANMQAEHSQQIARMQAEHDKQIRDLHREYEKKLAGLQLEIEKFYRERSEAVNVDG